MSRYKYGAKRNTSFNLHTPVKTASLKLPKIRGEAINEVDALAEKMECLDDALSELESASQNVVDQIDDIRDSIVTLESFC